MHSEWMQRMRQGVLGVGLTLTWLGGCGGGMSPEDGAPLHAKASEGRAGALLSAAEGELPAPGGAFRAPGAPSVALGPEGRPVVVWSDLNDSGRFLAVLAWDGTQWKRLGEGPTPIQGGARRAPLHPVLAVDANGRPIVAWTDISAQNERQLYVSRWTGQQWEALGGPLGPAQGYAGATLPSLALDTAGRPVVAWTASNGVGTDILVSRWNGKRWTPVGEPLQGLDGRSTSATPALVLDAADNPWVAWTSSNASSGVIRVLIRRWAEGSWRDLGGPQGARGESGAALQPSLACMPDGRVFLAWSEAAPGAPAQVYAQQWDGEHWNALPQPRGATGESRGGAVRLGVDASGEPLLVWVGEDTTSDGQLNAAQWNRTDWTLLPPLSNTLGSRAQAPSLASSSSGTISIAWLWQHHIDAAVSVFFQSVDSSAY
jgi:hypothetical protein